MEKNNHISSWLSYELKVSIGNFTNDIKSFVSITLAPILVPPTWINIESESVGKKHVYNLVLENNLSN